MYDVAKDQAKEQERLKQLAVNNRKRSSRIATRELEREEIVTRQRAQRDVEERMTAQQKEERRIAREQEEALARERAREDRLREREERAAAREEAAARKLIEEQEQAQREEKREEALKERAEKKRKRDASGGVSKSAGDAGERWELACEVCRKTGWNIVCLPLAPIESALTTGRGSGPGMLRRLRSMAAH